MDITEKAIKFFEVHSKSKESQSPRNGFLSYSGEFHSLAIGLAVGVYAAIQNQPELVAAMLAVALGLGVGSKAVDRLEKALKDSGGGGFKNALSEVRREPWYNLLGLAVGYTVGQWDIAAIQQVADVALELV